MRSSIGETTNNRSGFTLIEVVISLTVITAIGLMFAATIPAAKKSAYMNGQYAQATSLCQHKVDQLRAIGPGRMKAFDDLNDAGIIDDSPIGSPYSFKLVDSVENYLPNSTATLTIQSHPSDPDAMIATVTITWKPAKHQAHTSTMSVSAIVTNQGV